METKYLLLGQDAVKVYQENDSIDKLLETDYCSFGLLVVTKDSDPIDILNRINGWWEWCEITKEQYDKLYNSLRMEDDEEEEEFDFHLDSKHTIWYRNSFSVMAKTREEAIEKAIEKMKNFDDYDNVELLVDTAEEMSPIENYNQSTQELFIAWEAGDAIWSNGLFK